MVIKRPVRQPNNKTIKDLLPTKKPTEALLLVVSVAGIISNTDHPIRMLVLVLGLAVAMFVMMRKR